MNFTTENITPTKAQEYLLTSEGNRNMSKIYVRSYADTMKRGEWRQNGVPIIFDTDGHLLDGHHRLEAIILANIPITMEVCRGVSKDAFNTYDCGRHRTLGQLLAMQGVKNYNAVAAIVSVNENLVQTGRIWTDPSANRNGIKRSNRDGYFLYASDREGYSKAADVALEMLREANLITGSWLGGIIYYLTHTGGYDFDFVTEFFKNVCSLSESPIPQANVLRKRLTAERINRNTSLIASQMFAFIALAWNAYVKGKTISILRYVPERDRFPEFILNTNKTKRIGF